MHVNIKVWNTFRSGNHALYKKHTATSICTQRHITQKQPKEQVYVYTSIWHTHTYMHKHNTHSPKHMQIHMGQQTELTSPQLHTPIQTHRMCEILHEKFFLARRCRVKAALPTVYMPNTVDVMNGCNHNICIRAYTLWQTRTHCWAGFRVRDHFLPWGLGDGLLLFWPIPREHWLTPPAHWSWVINYQAVPCLGQMNISTWLPWNNEPHPKSLNRPILCAFIYTV